MKRVALEKVIVTGVRLVDHHSPDIISLQTEDGYSFEVKTYRLIDSDMESLRSAILSGETNVKVVLEVTE